jgi:hypothetical protein
MDDFSKTKIWRYMDLGRFASLLTSRSLYFACPTDLQDPYEGLLPRSYTEAMSTMLQPMVDDFLSLRAQLVSLGRDTQRLGDSLATLPQRMAAVQKVATSKFGVSCWHANEHESDAMWKLYSASGQGIAIESSVEQLRASIGDRKDLVIDRVRYADFDRDEIEKGHKHLSLFMKRKCFEHEKEVRATVLLPAQGKGILVPCNLDVLVTSLHVSPLVEKYVKDVIEALCSGNTQALNKPVRQSILYCAPDYQIDIKTD